MIRTLYPSPGSVDFLVLRNELTAVVGDCLGVNDVDGQVAVYTVVQPDESFVAEVIAAHEGPIPEAPDPLLLLAQAIVDATSLDDLKPVAEQILSGEGP